MKKLLLLAGLNLALSGCADAPPAEAPQAPPPPPTVVNLQIETNSNLNADTNGKGAPVVLRVYELRESGNFNSADFFALYNNEQATLAADLSRKQEAMLQPGSSKKLNLKPQEGVTALGFFAAFRQVDSALWRAGVEIKAHETQTFTIKLNNNQLTVEPAP